VGSRSDALMADYEYGRRTGELMLEQLHEWLDIPGGLPVGLVDEPVVEFQP